MTVSIRTALKNVASENYDKKNIFIYLVLLFMCGICASFIPDGKGDVKPHASLPYLIYFILLVIITGINTLATNNAIKKRKGVFPNPLENFRKIFSAAASYMVGGSITMFLPCFVSAFLVAFAVTINPFACLIVIPIMLFVLYFWIGLYFNFVITLKFNAWFNLKKASEFLKRAKGKFGSYVLKVIGLQLLSGFIVFLIVFIPMVILSFVATTAGAGNSKTAEMILTSICTFVSTIVFGICSIYMVDLTGQFVRDVFPKPPKKRIIKESIVKEEI